MAKCTYKGHELEANREKSLGGNSPVYISIMRLDDFTVIDYSPYDGDDSIWEIIKILRRRVDREIETCGSYEPGVRLVRGSKVYYKVTTTGTPQKKRRENVKR